VGVVKKGRVSHVPQSRISVAYREKPKKPEKPEKKPEKTGKKRKKTEKTGKGSQNIKACRIENTLKVVTSL
jgi:hypothetical protein